MKYLSKISFAAIILFVSLGQTYSQNQNAALGQDGLVATTTTTLKIFDTPFVINTYEVKKDEKQSPITFLVVHNNEQTGLNLVKETIKNRGGKLIEIVNDKKRNLSFKFKVNTKEETFCIDPNRIYSDVGRVKDLMNTEKECLIPEGEELVKIKQEVEQFSEQFLDLFLPKKRCSPGQQLERRLCSEEVLVAVHNNTPLEDVLNKKDYNVKHFINLRGLETPGKESNTVNSVYLVNKEELDNFILVSNSVLGNKLLNPISRQKAFNVVFQKEANLDDDGSMSIFCGIRKIDYLIIEAAHVKGKERQKEMINTVFNLFPPR